MHVVETEVTDGQKQKSGPRMFQLFGGVSRLNNVLQLRPIAFTLAFRFRDVLFIQVNLPTPCLPPTSYTSISDAAHIIMPPLYNRISSVPSSSPKPSHLAQPQPLLSSQANSTPFTPLVVASATSSLLTYYPNSPPTAQKSIRPFAGAKQPSMALVS